MIRLLVILAVLMMVFRILVLLNPEPLNWFGKLPGDIRFETAERTVYIPLTSLFVVAIGVILLIYLAKRLIT